MAEKSKEKVTMMKLKVDLDCAKCYKKVKKVLSKFPQIRDQLFDEKSNIVIIKVVCCSPERLMDKLCSKGGGSIKTIAIIEPPKPPPAQPPPQKFKESENPTTSKPAPPTAPSHAPVPKQPGPPQPVVPKQPVPPQPAVPKQPAPPQPVVPKQPGPQHPPVVPKQPGPPPQPVPMMPQGQPVAMCCWPYYDGFGGGPAFYGYGMMLPQPYECYGRPVYDSWGGGPPPCYLPCHHSRCNNFSQETPQSCSIM